MLAVTDRRALLVALAVWNSLALLAGVSTAVLRSGSPPNGSARVSSDPATPLPSVVPSLGIQALVPELSRFVERERGLRFRTPVTVTLLGDAAFRDRLAEEGDESTEQVEPEPEVAVTLQALGLIEPGTDLDEAIESLTGDTVAGFYDPENDELVVRGDTATPLVRTVLVHELTHALQDQHFDLDRPELEDRDDEAFLGYLGLVEGDASVVEQAYRDQLSKRDRSALDAEEERLYGDTGEDAPEVLLALFGFPYEVGPQFVEQLRDARGQAGLDAAFESPPQSSEHLLHIASFLREDNPRVLADPRGRGTVVDRGVLGELGLLVTLGLSPAGKVRDAVDDVDDWGGDRYVSWRDGSRACTAAIIVMDTDAAAGELRSALDRWAERRAGASIGGSARQITLDACA